MASMTFKTSNIQTCMKNLTCQYPWSKTPLIIGAPMKLLSGPSLAVSISEAGGIGFVGPGNKPENLEKEIENSITLISSKNNSLTSYLESSGILPIGFGIQTWTSDLSITSNILRKIANSSPPCAIWLFAPRNGQKEIDSWSQEIRLASPRTQIWLQVASINESISAANSDFSPDVLVLQGTDAGGHSRTQGASIMTLVPEVSDALVKKTSTIPIIAAGGIADGRGVAAALTLGASGVAVGTRFLVTSEASINPGYQRAIIDAYDGGQTTVRTQFYNHLRGTIDWPEGYDARGIINASWRDHVSGMSFEENKKLHDLALKNGQDAWGEQHGRTATYAGTNVGLINEVETAGKIVEEMRDIAKTVLSKTRQNLDFF